MIDHRFIMLCLMAAFYFAAGILHFKSPHGFVLIVPSIIPRPELVVWFTGLVEIVGALALLIPNLRYTAGIGLALYAVAVFPANINHAFNMIEIGGLPNSWWYHGPRFMLQPVLVWWALYCSRVISWPFK